jgi:hypothetical protein
MISTKNGQGNMNALDYIIMVVFLLICDPSRTVNDLQPSGIFIRADSANNYMTMNVAGVLVSAPTTWGIPEPYFVYHFFDRYRHLSGCRTSIALLTPAQHYMFSGGRLPWKSLVEVSNFFRRFLPALGVDCPGSQNF